MFLSVARHGQLLAAARKLGINHATAARRLSALEAALGQPLFERRPDGSTATPTALQLLPAIERIEVEIIRIVERLRNEDALAAGTVRVGAPEGLGNHFLAVELGTLTALHRNLVVELVPLSQAFSIAKREVDIAICVDQPNEERVIVSRLSDYTLSTYGFSRLPTEAW
ncbi:LysR family transcriptional regulator [Bradyrhizobium sp. WD16]|uniref:LysR family transcriptional regulator n=1 Tax=Bradyrhizobium sp. WD16 TaxID=1521768 RepID=UPI0020A5CBFC|nr:LysR family transcriptional regulator [Bradyrhizobium sp. WD16]